jgi:hypothetical protein
LRNLQAKAPTKSRNFSEVLSQLGWIDIDRANEKKAFLRLIGERDI